MTCDRCHIAQITPKQAFLAMCKYNDIHSRLCGDCQALEDELLTKRELRKVTAYYARRVIEQYKGTLNKLAQE